METIMSGLPRAPQQRSLGTVASRIGRTLQRWWIAYMDWRLQRLALDRLGRLSDRQLSDIGLSRSQIEAAVRAPADRHQPFNSLNF
jgi:uncharacterized protein YjiS (DUF1127 family)